MTEPIERELAELFSDRAERLDVRPPLPMAQLRRARLQSGLAVAAVVAVLAGGTVVGARLANQASGRDVAVASSGSPAHDLEQITRRMLAGRWHAVVTFGGSGGSVTVIDIDGPAKTAITRDGDRIGMIEVGGRAYLALPPNDPSTRFLPAGAKWQGLPDGSTTFGNDGSAGFGFGAILPANSMDRLDRAGVQVRRTRTGFRLDASGAAHNRTVTDVRIGPDGMITALHSVVTTSFQGGRRYVIDATISPLNEPLHVTAPDPRTVVTPAQWAAAMEKMNGPIAVSPHQPETCRTTSATDQNGMTNNTVECSTQVQILQATPVPIPFPSHS